MFRESYKLYWGCLSHVGSNGRTYSLGCAISPHHVLTAAHVISTAITEDPPPMATMGTSIFRAEVVFNDAELDLAVLRTGVAVYEHKSCHRLPARFPLISTAMPTPGTSVGFMGSVTRPETDADDREDIGLITGALSFLVKESQSGLRLAISGGFAQEGFSGTAVFDQKGDLLGVMVQTMQFRAGLRSRVPYMVNMPIMAAISPIADKLQKIISSDT